MQKDPFQSLSKHEYELYFISGGMNSKPMSTQAADKRFSFIVYSAEVLMCSHPHFGPVHDHCIYTCKTEETLTHKIALTISYID